MMPTPFILTPNVTLRELFDLTPTATLNETFVFTPNAALRGMLDRAPNATLQELFNLPSNSTEQLAPNAKMDTSSGRKRVYCCMSKVGKCKTRLEKRDGKTKVMSGEYQQHFAEYVGENLHLFKEDDVVCDKHYMNMKVSYSEFQTCRKRPASPVIALANPQKQLRSGKTLDSRTIPVSDIHSVAGYEDTESFRWSHNSGPSHQSMHFPAFEEFSAEFDYSYDERSLFDRYGALDANHNEGAPSAEVPESQQSILSNNISEINLEMSQVSEEGPFQPEEDSHAQVPAWQNSRMSRNMSELDIGISQVSNNHSESQVSHQSQISSAESETSSASSVLAFRHIQGTRSTQSRCFICDSKENRTVVPWNAVRQVWFILNFYIPKTNRVCKTHLDENRRFTPEALSLIQATKQGIYVTSYDLGLWLHEVSDFKLKPPYSFEPDGVEACRYKKWLGINKDDFDDLLGYIPHSEMYDTSARTRRNGLAMFLIVLRTNLKQTAIADMFATSQQVVSQAIDKVSSTLERLFVPQFLGYLHITRDDALERHSRRLTSRVLEEPETRLCVIADATYNYIEKPGDFWLQRKTFSSHKKRNLLKPLYIVFPSGYILAVAGPYFCDSTNNDAVNMQHHYANSDLLLFLEEEDFFLFDRGYRDIVQETEAHRISVHMPSLLDKKRKQFTCAEANQSRKVSVSRRIVESVFGRIKNVFPWFKHTIEGSYCPKIGRFNNIVAAIMNKYFPPLYENEDFHELIADAARETTNTNALKEEIETQGLLRMTTKWEKATADSVPEFPKMTWTDLKRLTLGSYQLKIADRYNQQHMKADQNYGIFIHRHLDGLIRAKINSRFQKCKSHSCWVKFSPGEEGFEAIKGIYCTCKVGERTLGCCSHLTAVVRYLAYDRYQPKATNTRRQSSWGAIDCEGMFSEELGSEDLDESSSMP